ncbi:MAG: DoxX family protein [Methyloceanibacter sp.]|jgi:putative oxidoreductase|nr:DoxX family protein [Methyloceanibacter sp.]
MIDRFAPYLLTLARLLLAPVFLQSGISKIFDYASMQALMESHGLPGILLGPTIALEVLGGLGVLFGLGTRWAALGLAGFCGLAAVVFHSNLSGHGQTIDFLENLSMAGGLLALAAAGPGAFALEHRRR